MQYDKYDLLKPKNQKEKTNSVKSNGVCPICKRDMIKGKSVDEHHFIPKSKKGKEKTLLHVICHRKLHSVFSEKEMANYYNTPERCLEHKEIQTFVKWVAKKEPEYTSSNREHNDKKKRR